MSTVLVTGANRGIGLELTRQYTEDGWHVRACCRSDSDALKQLQDAHPDRISLHQLDVGDHESVDRLADSLSGEPVDVLINNAGRYGKLPLSGGGEEDQSFGHSDYDDWAYTMRINVFGPMKVSEALIENVAGSEMKKIAHITSFLGSSTLNTRTASGEFAGGMYAYRTSKTSVNIMARSMAVDLEPKGITVLAVHPGWVQTDMGGPDAQLTPADSVAGIRSVIAAATIRESGSLSTYDGSVLPP
jgi:NAD(P)-dependent dehydrogenase (short-subunit alcohol dehydrogenase family)